MASDRKQWQGYDRQVGRRGAGRCSRVAACGSDEPGSSRRPPDRETTTTLDGQASEAAGYEAGRAGDPPFVVPFDIGYEAGYASSLRKKERRIGNVELTSTAGRHRSGNPHHRSDDRRQETRPEGRMDFPLGGWPGSTP